MEKSSNKRYVVTGTVLTILYFALLITLSYPAGIYKFLTTAELNEIGDFLAGAFSPIAFLWLVIGYFMQSKELRMQREAFVRQTQLTENELELQRRSADPYFDLAQTQPTDGRVFTLQNKSTRIARQVIIYHVDHDNETRQILAIADQLPEEGQTTFNIKENLTMPDREGRHAELHIIYNSNLDDLRCQRFGLTLTDQALVVGWQIEPANCISAQSRRITE